MSKLFLLFIYLFIIPTITAISSPLDKLKKITIIESNNERLDDRFHTLTIPNTLQDSILVSLKKHVSASLSTNNLSDPEVFFKVMEWVGIQWKHNGFNEPPPDASSLDILMLAKSGTEFRCLEYGRVVSDVLLSLGYVSRLIGMNSKEIAYGALGMGHAASEVWSNTLQKWIYIDPQFCVYAKYKGEYLNYYDIYLLRKQGKYNQIEFIVSDLFLTKYGLKKQQVISEYRKFLDPYFGYLMTPYFRDNKISLITLSLDSKDQFLTSQGLTARSMIYTQNPRDLYYALNHTLVIFNYKESSPNLQQILSDFKINNNDEYLANMYLFAAKPNFTLNLQNNMPWFSHYEVKIDNGNWISLTKDEFDWNVQEGESAIFVRSVNQSGITGIVTKIKIKYN